MWWSVSPPGREHNGQDFVCCRSRPVVHQALQTVLRNEERTEGGTKEEEEEEEEAEELCPPAFREAAHEPAPTRLPASSTRLLSELQRQGTLSMWILCMLDQVPRPRLKGNSPIRPRSLLVAVPPQARPSR
ncbi:unnamed protein product [Prorocentrum cordatum]|uniref:Uncharacterized protein n=1 Tax=Prorocentrum cordatum TaxID=2364126 RepID=A0ABN9WQH7_9DINO|nr:unnamed protein product [Polarella glacialis]